MESKFQLDEYRKKVFDSVQLGIWVIEFENGKLPRMYTDKVMKGILDINENITPQECYGIWYSRIFSSYVNSIEQAVGELITGKQAEVTYPWMSQTNHLKYFRCGGERDFSYTDGIRLYGYHHDVTHIILEEKRKRSSEKPIISEYILKVLTSIYDAIHIVDFRTQKVIPFISMKNDDFNGNEMSIDEYLENISKYVDKNMVNFLSNSIKRQNLFNDDGKEIPYYTCDYKKNISGVERWYNIFVCMDETNSNSIMVVSFKDINETKIEQQNTHKTIENLKKKSEIDNLTGIFNRAAMESKIKEYLKTQTATCAFILIDLDNFKKVNDTFGHIEGDILLIETAEKLKQLCMINGDVGRLGGDEFVMFIKYISPEQDFKPLVSKINSQLTHSYVTESKETITVTASIGIAISNSENNDFTSLYNIADNALYESKRKGKNTYTIHT